MNRLPIVGVMGSGTDEHSDLAEPLGERIASMGCHLLTGGRGGVMEAVGRGFCRVADRAGCSIGVLPDGTRPNPFVEIPIYTQLSSANDRNSPAWRWSRNHVNVRSSTLVVALPGGAGTASELELAAAGEHSRPCIAFLGVSESVGALASESGSLITESGVRIPVASNVDDVETFVRQHLPGTD